MKRKIGACFNRAGSTYAAAATVQALVAAECAAQCPRQGVGLAVEIGAGTGLLTRLVRPMLGNGLYVAIDLAPGMIAAASPRTARLVADGEHLPLRPGCADLLLSASAMHWFLEPERSIPACLALLRPGGMFRLALFIHGTLRELAEASAATGFGSVFPLRTADYYCTLLASLPGVRFAAETSAHTQTLGSVRHLFDTLRRTGTNYSPRRRPASARNFRAFCAWYEERYAVEGGVAATYCVLHLRGEVQR